MNERCNPESIVVKMNPTYENCKISENFSNMEFFEVWCEKQVGFATKDESGRYFCLDKDTLSKESKLYCESHCVFIPTKLNTLLNGGSAEKILSRGVTMHYDGKFRARCRDINGKMKHLGLFSDVLSASIAYSAFKANVVKECANKYKYLLDPRVYESLMIYKCEG